MDVEVTPNVLVVLVAVTEQLPATVTLATAESVASTLEFTVTVFKICLCSSCEPWRGWPTDSCCIICAYRFRYSYRSFCYGEDEVNNYSSIKEPENPDTRVSAAVREAQA